MSSPDKKWDYLARLNANGELAGYSIRAPDGWLVEEEGPSPIEARKRADYVVSAANACRGMADPAAEIAAMREVVAALVMVRDADDDCRKDGLPSIPAPARARIDAAIAKAEGGAA